MDPAIAFCATVAAVALMTSALVGVVPAARRIAAIRVPLPIRSVAAVVAMASLLAVVSRPRPAGASVEPPVVRLTDTPTVGPDEADEPETEREVEPAVGAATHRARRTDATGATYVVEPGDCLWRIARATLAERTGRSPAGAEIARFWRAIYTANRAVIGDDPNLIFPGQHLDIPEG
ncbi:MAG: LysM peptidoglycan-binding domain-containing protein [Actinomycetota bacterium]